MLLKYFDARTEDFKPKNIEDAYRLFMLNVHMKYLQVCQHIKVVQEIKNKNRILKLQWRFVRTECCC